MPTRHGHAALAVLALCACKSPAQSYDAGAPARYAKIDMHTHFGPRAVARIVQLLDDHGVDVAVNLSGGYPGGGLEQQLAAARAHPGKIIVFTTLDWRRPQLGPGYGYELAADVAQAHALGARGLKIPKGLGLGFGNYNGELIPIDAPELDPVFEMAGALNMPVSIHSGDPVAFWQPPTPNNERYAELGAHPAWSFYGTGLPSWEQLFAQFERRIARHPNTTFIGVHFGNAPEYPERVASLLARYPNLYIDTAARIPEIGRHDPARMRALFIEYQDRILFATDLMVGTHPMDLTLGSGGDSPPTAADVERFFGATWRYLESRDRSFPHPTPIQGDWTINGIGLPPGVLQKVYAGNARRLLGMPAAVP